MCDVLKAQQNQENCEYIKQNGHATLEEVRNHRDAGSDVKADDDLGFDPFHETQKALAELMENEMQIHQQRIYQQQQQQQQQREREEQNRAQHQQTFANLNQQHFPQVITRWKFSERNWYNGERTVKDWESDKNVNVILYIRKLVIYTPRCANYKY